MNCSFLSRVVAFYASVTKIPFGEKKGLIVIYIHLYSGTVPINRDINFKKLFGCTVFKKRHRNHLKSSSVWPMLGSLFI